MNPELPDTVVAGRYRLIGPIGQGGMGTIYKALDQVLNRVVAVKVFRSLTGWPKQALAREAQATSTLTHPNILRVFDFFETADSTAIVMEYIEGRALTDVFRETGPLDQNYAIEIATAVGNALDFAHRRGIVHRDVKPSNILISTAGRILLADFGLAIAPGADTLTSAGTILGTPRYMSPEQAMGRPLDGRSDIYALAIIVYEALSGGPWFRGSGSTDIFETLFRTGIEPIRQRNPEISGAIERVLVKALSKEPAARYQTADGFVQALRDAAHGSTFPVKPTGALRPPSMPEEELHDASDEAEDDGVDEDGRTTGALSPGYDAKVTLSAPRGRRVLLLAGLLTLGLIAAFMPRPASTVSTVLLIVLSTWYVVRRLTAKLPVPLGQTAEPPETTEAAPYEGISPPPSRPRTFGQAFVDAPTAETPAYLPADLRPTPALQDPTAGSWLLVLNGPHQGRQFSLGLNVAIGRSPSNAVVLDNDPGVSRRHAEIVLQGSRFELRDLRSRTGTLVNNVKVEHRELRDRDQIRVGGTTLLFISAAETDETGADAKRRLVALDHRMVLFSAIWNDLTRVAHDDE